MAKKRYQLTGFARFFIVMLFLVPIALFTANYVVNGNFNVMEMFEETTGGSKGTTTTTTTTTSTSKSRQDLLEENNMLRDSIRSLNLQYQELKREYRLLEDKVGEK